MDLTDLSTIKKLLKRHMLWAKKGFGQNFMIDRTVIDDTVKAAELSVEDNVLEIGPGLGVLTLELCKHAGKVVAVEKDEHIIGPLIEISGGLRNLEIRNEDILKVKVTEGDKISDKVILASEARPESDSGQAGMTERGSIFGNEPYKIVANLPFYVSSPIFRKFLEFERRPETMTVVVQKEVAEKVCAKPGDMNILAVSVQFYGKPELVRTIPKTSFFPEPKVDAAILKIKTYEKPPFDVDSKKFFRIVKAGFGEKRKKLANSLSGGLQIEKEKIEKILEELNLDKNIRAESLSLDNWFKLYLRLANVL